MLKVRRPTGMPGLEIALGWHVRTIEGKEIVWHNGGTGGFRSFMGFDPSARTGVVALSNTFTTTGVDDMAMHLLDAKSPLAPPVKQHTQVKVDPKIYDGYLGTYELAPSFIITITRDGDHLFEQATGQPKFEIFPESERDFFLKVVDAQITFVTDSSGRATELILHQNGRDVHGKRFEGEPPKPPEHKQVSVDPKIFDGYVGTYQLAPGVVFTITRDADHLYAQLTGQQTFEIFPESKTDFFYKVVDAQITFVTDSTGRATELILHESGIDQHAKRIE